jgi:hypothetical protein
MDTRPSLHIADKGTLVVFVCRAGCAQREVIAALEQRGLWSSAVIASHIRESAFAQRIATELVSAAPACCLDREYRCEHWLEFDRRYLIAALRDKVSTAVAELAEKAARGVNYQCELRVSSAPMSAAELHDGVQFASAFGAIVPLGVPAEITDRIIDEEIAAYLAGGLKHVA